MWIVTKIDAGKSAGKRATNARKASIAPADPPMAITSRRAALLMHEGKTLLHIGLSVGAVLFATLTMMDSRVPDQRPLART